MEKDAAGCPSLPSHYGLTNPGTSRTSPAAYLTPKDARFRGWVMPYQYVREPLTAEESDRLSNACETPAERLVVWALLDTGLRVGELCRLTSKNVLWQP